MPVCRAQDEAPSRIVILYDAFGPETTLRMDWGFSALIEHRGKRVLFDTGNDREIFAHNVRERGVDLTKLDAAVISHRHGDHTTGLTHLLQVNPRVPIFAPLEGAQFGMSATREFYARAPGLPKELQYFRGDEPERWRSGSPWEEADFRVVRDTAAIAPGIHVLSTRSEKRGSLEMNELSLILETERGLVIVVGCSRPGVEVIAQAAKRFGDGIDLVTGGFHLVMTRPVEIQRVADVLQGELGVRRVAPGHCTSEIGFSIFRQTYQDHFIPAGLGTVIDLK